MITHASIRHSIHEALSLGALDRVVGPLRILDAELASVVPVESSLVEVALYVLLADSAVRAVDLPLDDRTRPCSHERLRARIRQRVIDCRVSREHLIKVAVV